MERLEKGQPTEDDTIELKTEWPRDHFRAARRIAAHANAARGEPILWIIGVDEKRGAVGADFEELSTWFARVKSRFDQLMAPNLISMAIPYEGKTLVALLFETDRAPFVVRIPDSQGIVSHEVPWREANSTRSARRSDLIKLLYPIQKKPSLEILDGKIELQKSISGSDEQRYHWSLSMRVYIITFARETVVIPFHRCSIIFRPEGRPDEQKVENIKISPPTSYSTRALKQTNQSLTIESTDNEVLVNTAGLAYLTGDLYSCDKPGPKLFEQVIVKGRLSTHEASDPIGFEAQFNLTAKSAEKNDSDRLIGEWKYCSDSSAD